MSLPIDQNVAFNSQHVEKVFKHKQLELQLAEAKMAQQHLEFDEDKKKTLTENQLVRNLTIYYCYYGVKNVLMHLCKTTS